MTLTSPRRTKKKCVFTPADEGTCSQVEDQTAIHFLVEVEIEIIQRLLRVAKLRLLATSLQQPFAATSQFIRYQTGDQIDRCHPFGLGLAQTGLQHGSYAAEPQLFQGTVQLNQIHGCSSFSLSFVLWLIRSRYCTRSRISGSTCC